MNVRGLHVVRIVRSVTRVMGVVDLYIYGVESSVFFVTVSLKHPGVTTTISVSGAEGHSVEFF